MGQQEIKTVKVSDVPMTPDLKTKLIDKCYQQACLDVLATYEAAIVAKLEHVRDLDQRFDIEKGLEALRSTQLMLMFNTGLHGNVIDPDPDTQIFLAPNPSISWVSEAGEMTKQ